MGSGGGSVPVLRFWVLLVVLGIPAASATVVLVGRNLTLSFADMEANFAPIVRESGECGVLFLAEPLNACSPLTRKADGQASSFALIIRGSCQFDEKVRHAQDAGFKAAIVYDNDYNGNLVAMSGNPSGIAIYAVFVARATGEVLQKYAGFSDVEVWITPAFGYSVWSILAILVISLIAVSAVLATCFFAHRHSISNPRSASQARESHGMSSQSVKAMPSMTFTYAMEDNCTSATCAICLDDYCAGDKLRILPCRHKFHAACVDLWLTSWRTFCPVCKRDARTSMDKPPPSECTPLLIAGSTSSPSVSSLTSVRSSAAMQTSSLLPAVSPAIQIVSSLPRSTTSRSHSLSSTPHSLLQRRSYNCSPAIHISRSSAELQNLSSQRAQAVRMSSAHSLGIPLSSSMTSRFMSPYGYGSGSSSPSYLLNSSRHHYIPHSESARNFSAQASAESLPEY